MGGANFPGDMPWEGGKKKWYNSIFVLSEEGEWKKSGQVLPEEAGYGVTVSHAGRVILVGGSTPAGHLKRVLSVEWRDGRLEMERLPDLPVPLANMSGILLESAVVVFGGSEHPAGPALARAFVLDLAGKQPAWQELGMGDIPGRIFPVCGVYDGRIYLMGGETTRLNRLGKPYRAILLDAYSLQLKKEGKAWKGAWQALAPMPRGASAAGTVLPLLSGDRFLLWGGVDAVTAQFRDAGTHPGITSSFLYYFPEQDTWEYIGDQKKFAAPVTLPVVYWNGLWVYLSGEVKPGIRTPALIGVR